VSLYTAACGGGGWRVVCVCGGGWGVVGQINSRGCFSALLWSCVFRCVQACILCSMLRVAVVTCLSVCVLLRDIVTLKIQHYRNVVRLCACACAVQLCFYVHQACVHTLEVTVVCCWLQLTVHPVMELHELLLRVCRIVISMQT
jgi:hypothetical protein